MSTLHVLRSRPDDHALELIEASAHEECERFGLYEKDIDYDRPCFT